MLSPRNITLAILIRVTTIALALAACNTALAVTVNGNSLALKSDGAASGNSWILSNNGYVGTYITLAAPGAVTVDVQATGASNPAMDIVINDTKSSYTVATSTNTYSKTFNLPAGTHLIRTQLTNDPGVATRQLTINSITVTGATVSNTNTNALAASDTYISNYRKGNATVKIAGLFDGVLFPYLSESAKPSMTDSSRVEAEVREVKAEFNSIPVFVDVYATGYSSLGRTTPHYVREVMESGHRAADGVLIYCHQGKTQAPEKYDIIKGLFSQCSANRPK
jgi:Ca-dependent carbohydrate-binding module xylan-binding